MFSSHKVGGSPRVLEKDSREASHRHSHHQQMVVKHYLKGETEGLLVTAQAQVTPETTRKLIVASKWRANAECVCKMKRQWIILYLDVSY